VEVVIDLTDRRVDMIEEGIDLALREGPLDDSSLVVRSLGAPQRLLTYAAPEYLKRRGDPRRPRDVEAHDCLAMGGHREPDRWRYYARGKAIVVQVRPWMTANSFSLLRALATEGHGIVRLPERTARAAVAEGRLRATLDKYAPPARALHALYPSARHAAPKVTAFVDLIQALLKAQGQ
jgi:DNA-binding transcriptional LysR family regulator